MTLRRPADARRAAWTYYGIGGFGTRGVAFSLQKGQLFHNGRNGRYKGHYRTENCTKQEAPPEDKRPTFHSASML